MTFCWCKGSIYKLTNKIYLNYFQSLLIGFSYKINYNQYL